MKYIILAITLLFSSCGIKNKITKWNNSGELGIPKQNSIVAEIKPIQTMLVDVKDNESNVHETYYQSESSEQPTSDNNSYWFCDTFHRSCSYCSVGASVKETKYKSL